MFISYQLDLVTPGICPSLASFLKQILHISNFRIYPRGRPQILQRLTFLVLYFGVLFALTINDFFAILFYSTLFSKRHTQLFQQGKPLFIGLGRSHDSNIQPTHTLDFVVIDFGENNLLGNPE